MNYLAHTLLSKKSIDYQLGNLLADPLKGRSWYGCSQEHINGMLMHRSIDSFTDSNKHVRRAKSRLGDGYLKGVVVDIMFDHFITCHWQQFVNIDFEMFVEDFYRHSAKQISQLPEEGAVFIQKVIRYDFFHLYGQVEQLQHVFKKFDERLSARILQKESTSQYFPRLKTNYAEIEVDFLQFFPELIRFFIDQSQANRGEHYFLE